MRKRHLAFGAALAAGALLLAGCSGTSDSGSDSTDGTGKTLTLWHYEGEDSAMGKAWNQAIADFEKETGAKVKFEAKAFEQIRSTASQVLNSNEAPDILEYTRATRPRVCSPARASSPILTTR